jgi:hypothetical protein
LPAPGGDIGKWSHVDLFATRFIRLVPEPVEAWRKGQEKIEEKKVVVAENAIEG